MDQNENYIELVKRARLGDDKSLEQLAQNVRGRLYAYVYRMVLDADAAQDIVQESMLEMFKILGKLEKDDRFWPWLRGIAFNKMRRHAAKERRHRKIPIRETARAKSAPGPAGESLADAVGEEIKQIVVKAMGEL